MRTARLWGSIALFLVVVSQTRLANASSPLDTTTDASRWAGAYAGLNLGLLYGDDRGSLFCSNSGCLFDRYGASAIALAEPVGLLGGPQTGFNFQADHFVFGPEADFQGSSAEGQSSFSLPAIIGGFRSRQNYAVSSRIQWFGTVRGRVGYALFESLLVYATGGLFYDDGNVSSDFSYRYLRTNVTYPASNASIRAGWTAGGGAEYALNQKWSLKAESLFYDLGQTATVSNRSIGSEGKVFNLSGKIARLGLNYKFCD